MRRLFQQFVLNFYRRHSDFRVIGERQVRWEAVPENEESAALLPQMNVDISLTSPDRRILIDTKFTSRSLQRHPHSEIRKLRSEHMYQMYGYLSNVSAEEPDKALEGILLYPTVENELDLAYRMPDMRLRVATVNLAADWPSIHGRLMKLTG